MAPCDEKWAASYLEHVLPTQRQGGPPGQAVWHVVQQVQQHGHGGVGAGQGLVGGNTKGTRIQVSRPAKGRSLAPAMSITCESRCKLCGPSPRVTHIGDGVLQHVPHIRQTKDALAAAAATVRRAAVPIPVPVPVGPSSSRLHPLAHRADHLQQAHISCVAQYKGQRPSALRSNHVFHVFNGTPAAG